MKHLSLDNYDVQSLTSIEKVTICGGDQASKDFGDFIGMLGAKIHKAWDAIVEFNREHADYAPFCPLR